MGGCHCPNPQGNTHQETKENDRQRVRSLFFLRRCLEVKARGCRGKDSACPFPVSAPCGAFSSKRPKLLPPLQSVCDALLCSGRHGASGGCNDSADLWGQKSCGRSQKRTCGLLSNAEVSAAKLISPHVVLAWDVRRLALTICACKPTLRRVAHTKDAERFQVFSSSFFQVCRTFGIAYFFEILTSL